MVIALLVLTHVILSQTLEHDLKSDGFHEQLALYAVITVLLTCMFLTAIALLVIATRTMDKIETAGGQ